jgi:magnesium transporter
MQEKKKIERIYRLRAGLLNMRHAVSPMIEICNQLRRHHFSGGSSAIRPYLRDVHDHVLLVNEAIADLQSAAAASSQSAVSAHAKRHRQKLAAGPPYWRCRRGSRHHGMNFKYMPELECPSAIQRHC